MDVEFKCASSSTESSKNLWKTFSLLGCYTAYVGGSFSKVLEQPVGVIVIVRRSKLDWTA